MSKCEKGEKFICRAKVATISDIEKIRREISEMIGTESHPIRSCSCLSNASARLITEVITSCSLSDRGFGLQPYLSYNSALTDQPIRNLRTQIVRTR